MNRVMTDELSDWVFPDLQEYVAENESSIISDQSKRAETENKEEIKIETPPETIHKISEAEEEHRRLTQELHLLKGEYEKKIELLNNLMVSFEKPLTVLNVEIIELLQHIISKSVKHIIHKEIKTDAELMKNVVHELSTLIDSKNGMITIHLSEVDFNRLNDQNNKPSLVFKIDKELSAGDIIIKSNFSEVRAVLDDRINHLLGIKHV